MGFKEDTFVGKVLIWALFFMWGRVASLLDVCESQHEYEDATQNAAWFEALV